MRSLRDLTQEFPTTTDKGLTADQVAQSRRHYGGNRLTPLPRESIWKKFLGKFDEPIIKILLAAALLSMLLDLFAPPVEASRYLAGGVAVVLAVMALAAAHLTDRAHWVPSLLFLAALVIWPLGVATGHGSVDALAVMVAVVLATGVAFLSEYKSDREFEILNARKEAQHVKALRAGRFETILLEDTVVGDAVVLEAGDEIPADGRVVKATD